MPRFNSLFNGVSALFLFFNILFTCSGHGSAPILTKVSCVAPLLLFIEEFSLVYMMITYLCLPDSYIRSLCNMFGTHTYRYCVERLVPVRY
jgi:hypothetical protein